MRVTLEDICLSFEGAAGERVRALDGVSLCLEGGVCGLMGQTGSGKTTLLEVIAGVVHPDSGRVHVGREVVARAGARGQSASIGLVFQIPERQFFEPTVEDEVTFGLLARGVSSTEARRRAEHALSIMGLSLEALGRRSPFALSGGQQLLLLDEPTAGLDPRAREACLAAVREAAAEGATVIMASHDANALAEVADRLVCLEAGRVTLDGPAREVLGDAELMRDRGLEPACAARAAAALRRAGVAVDGTPLDATELAVAVARGRGLL